MKDRTTKYIFVTGGVLSSLGKGLASASIGALLDVTARQTPMRISPADFRRSWRCSRPRCFPD